VSAVVHRLASSQGRALLGCVQVPPEQTSSVQGFPSLQSMGGNWQPLWGSQVFTVHAFPSSQVIGVPTQTPLVQVSPEVQAFPSLQDPVRIVCTQPCAASQTSLVQGFPSSHPAAVHWQPVTTTSSTASPGKNSEESLVRFQWSWIVLLE
jgi:hypothetical protein